MDFIYKNFTRSIFYSSKAVMGHGLNEWVPTNVNYVLFINKEGSVFNFKNIKMLFRHLVSFLMTLYEYRPYLTTLVVNGFPKRYSYIDLNIIKVLLSKFSKFFLIHWIPGILTNRKVIFTCLFKNKHNIFKNRLKYTWFDSNWYGFHLLKRLPALIFLLSISERFLNARDEAKKLNIPTVAIVDTNADSATVTFPFYGNDDSAMSIQFYLRLFKSIILTSRKMCNIRLKSNFQISSKLCIEMEYNYKSDKVKEIIKRGKDHLKNNKFYNMFNFINSNFDLKNKILDLLKRKLIFETLQHYFIKKKKF